MKMVWISKYLLFFKIYGWVFSQLIVAWDICTEPWNTLQPMTITISIFWWQVQKESIILSIKTPNLTRTHICIARKNVMLPQIVGLLFPFRCIIAIFWTGMLTLLNCGLHFCTGYLIAKTWPRSLRSRYVINSKSDNIKHRSNKYLNTWQVWDPWEIIQ